MERRGGHHAYSDNDLKELRDILRFKDPDLLPIEKLRRHTDEFAVRVGLAVRTERNIKTSARINKFEKEILAPAKALLASIEDPNLSKEFIQPWGGFEIGEVDPLRQDLAEFVERCARHLTLLSESGKQGKSWDSDLKRWHVHMTDILCEYLHPNLEPARSVSDGLEDDTYFREAVYLLAIPIFEQGTKFEGAIREFVDNWNANRRQILPQHGLIDDKR